MRHRHLFFGRHRGSHAGHGFGRFGRGFLEGSDGSRGFGMGRKLASADLQLLILRLLEEKPRHGYEVIKALDELSKGFYVPSPGMVYPALTYLEEIGHATVAADGARKLYHITATGTGHLQQSRSEADEMMLQFGRVGERMDRVRRAIHDGDEIDAEDEPSRHGSKELKRAAQQLRGAIIAKRGSPREEQQRIVQILLRATAQILGQQE